ncbi:MAG: DnaJ domain-containing protein [Planctomycetota bacterium]|jgi:DnaJ-class molecular chaperone
MAQDYYSILGVPKEASAKDIKKAFRQIARECHPDVAGEDPAAEDRFKRARKAYETLMDPVTRARYDRRGQRRVDPRGSFFDAFYQRTGDQSSKSTGPSSGAHTAGGHSSSRNAKRDPGNNLDLDDLFNDFGNFGFGNQQRPNSHRSTRRAEEPPPRQAGAPAQGADVHIELDVPARVAGEGGSVTAVYFRMQRAESWRPGSADPGVVRIQDVADVRITPATRSGVVLRERGLGDAGPYGGSYGDLVVRVRVQGEPKPKPKPRSRPKSTEAPPTPPGDQVV